MAPYDVDMAPSGSHHGAMDLGTYVGELRRELAVAAEAGGEEARALAERLTAPLESAAQLTLLNALSAAADEITRDLAPGSVDLRLRAGEPVFVVTRPPADQPVEDMDEPVVEAQSRPRPPMTEEGGTARINFRPPEHLKVRIEEAAAKEGLSVNAWLVRTVGALLDGPEERRIRPGKRSSRGGADRYTGWVR
jgi:hypothetical protein